MPEGDTGDDGEDLGSLADEVCLALAEQFVSNAVDTMLGDCANAGQFSIILDCLDDFFSQIDDISNGQFTDVECSHPEAAGEITDDGNSICSDGADECQAARDAIESAEVDIEEDG